jgi:hypothetical protein
MMSILPEHHESAPAGFFHGYLPEANNRDK